MCAHKSRYKLYKSECDIREYLNFFSTVQLVLCSSSEPILGYISLPVPLSGSAAQCSVLLSFSFSPGSLAPACSALEGWWLSWYSVSPNYTPKNYSVSLQIGASDISLLSLWHPHSLNPEGPWEQASESREKMHFLSEGKDVVLQSAVPFSDQQLVHLVIISMGYRLHLLPVCTAGNSLFQGTE